MININTKITICLENPEMLGNSVSVREMPEKKIVRKKLFVLVISWPVCCLFWSTLCFTDLLSIKSLSSMLYNNIFSVLVASKVTNAHRGSQNMGRSAAFESVDV